MDADKKGKHEVNRRTGEVSLPEAGEGAVIRFTMGAMEKLEGAYGDDWVQVIIKGMARMRIPIYQKIIACTLQGSSDGDIEAWDLTWEDLNIRILDALNLAIYGKTYEEQNKINEARMVAQLNGLQENPQMAAALSLMSATQPEPKQD